MIIRIFCPAENYQWLSLNVTQGYGAAPREAMIFRNNDADPVPL